MKFDSYSLIARGFPAIIASVPFYTFHYYLLNPIIGDFWGKLLGLKLAANVTLAVALLFLLIQVNRFLAKEIIEKKIYADGLKFPTTEFLLHTDSYLSPQHTKIIHEKILADFGIHIPSLEEETLDSQAARRRISEAVSLIRAKVASGNLVEQHNIEYGFVRNLIGASILASIMSLINFVIFLWFYSNKTALLISLFSFVVYSIFVLLGKRIINSAGISYAKVLIQEYLMN